MCVRVDIRKRPRNDIYRCIPAPCLHQPKCIALYMAENKAGISLQYEMQPSLPLGNDENTPMHYAVGGVFSYAACLLPFSQPFQAFTSPRRAGTGRRFHAGLAQQVHRARWLSEYPQRHESDVHSPGLRRISVEWLQWARRVVRATDTSTAVSAFLPPLPPPHPPVHAHTQ